MREAESLSTRERRPAGDRDWHTTKRNNEQLLATKDQMAGAQQALSPTERYLQAARMRAQPPPPSIEEWRPTVEQDGGGMAAALQMQSPAARCLQTASRVRDESVALNRDWMAATRQSRSPPTPERGVADELKQTATRRQRESLLTREKRRADGRDREARRRQNMSPATLLLCLRDKRERSAASRQSMSPSTRERYLAAERERTSAMRKDESPSARERRLANDRDWHTTRRQNERLLSTKDQMAGAVQVLSPIERYLQAARMRAQSSPPSIQAWQSTAEQDGAGMAAVLQRHSPAARSRHTARSPSTPERVLADNLEQTATRRQRESPLTREKRRADGRDRQAKSRRNMSPDTRLRYLRDKRERSAASRQNMSPSTRERYLVVARQHAAASRQNMSPSTRERHLAIARERAAASRQNMSPSTRERHRAVNRERTAARRRDMSPSTRERSVPLTASERPPGGRRSLRRPRRVAAPPTAHAYLRSGGSMPCPG